MHLIVIGVDTHKRSHTLVALDAATGATRGQLKIAATDDGTLKALRFAAELDTERVWAVEDCRHVSGRLERGLVASGDRVIRVAPGLTKTSRRAVREAGKSDPIDATAIARAAPKTKAKPRHPLPQTPPCATHLAPALRDRNPDTTTASASTGTAATAFKKTHQPDRRRRSWPHACAR